MKVYRFMSEDELKLYFNNQISKIGSCYEKKHSKSANSFIYKQNTRYVHFFKNLKDIKRIKHEYFHGKVPHNKRYYIGCFNIPLKILIKASGTGRYQNFFGSGYDDYPIQKATEYAIESAKIKEEYLIYFKQEKLDKDLHWKKDEMDKEK